MTGGSPSPTMRLRLWVFPLCIGLIVAWVSLTLRFSTRGDTLYNVQALLHGQPVSAGDEFLFITAFYNRVLFPMVHQVLTQWVPILSAGQWYLLLRIASFEAAFLVFAFVCLRMIKAQ